MRSDRSRRADDLSGRRVIVTGANSGIGRRTAQTLAAAGAHVVLACRHPERGAAAARRIAAATGNDQLVVVPLDLADMASIKAFAEQIQDPVDVLVNNAGVMSPPRRARTRDGFELQFGTNHLGHFVLTGLLLPALLESDAPRVVSVSSIAHRQGGRDVVDGNEPDPYDSGHTYGNSKLAVLLFSDELHRRSVAAGSRLVAVAAHPGVAATGLFSSPEGMGANRAVRMAAPALVRLFAQSAAAGARPVVYAATRAEPGSFVGPTWLGGVRGPIGPASRSQVAQDAGLARQLWTASEQLTGLRWSWPEPA